MVTTTPKYALASGREASLVEVVPHAFSDEVACVFEDRNGSRQYATQTEWLAGAEEFARYARDRQIVTSESPGREKIALFKSLFRGREDVYAHGYARKDGGIGYSPACAHEQTRRCPRWTRTIPGLKCADCTARSLIPVNDKAIIAHFKGERDDLRDVMGLFVLTPDCKTRVLVADFDKGSWQQEAAQYRDACRRFGLSPAVERSRSGNGAHVWLFFEKPVAAELARDLGCALITSAMSQGASMRFDSYDRLFPTQSTIAQGGFGNLIALPFQGRAQRLGNTVFVDDDFAPHSDQWRFLSSIAKVTEQQAVAIVGSSSGGPLGQLAFGSQPRPQARDATGSATMPAIGIESLSPGNFPKVLSVRKANMLLVDKQELSERAQNRVRRLAAFGNPLFYQAQAQHRSVRGIPRIVWCGDEDEITIMLPRGCEHKLTDLAREQGFALAIEDRRTTGNPIRVEFNGTLRDRQQKAADALLRHENGILMAPRPTSSSS